MKIMRLLAFFLFTIFSFQCFAQEKKVIFLPDSIALSFTKIPAGTFMMGSPEQEEGRDKDESPMTQVHIEKAFYLGTFEVTQKQWLAIMHYNPSTFKNHINHLDCPIETVSWQECQIFIKKLNDLGIGTFRLPTEAEWEYACRAGTKTAYYWGDENKPWVVNKLAWINSRSMALTHTVGEKPPNPWGLFDMAGNVWEWTSTTYSNYESIPKNENLKVFRGGSWFDFEKSQRSANRHKHEMHEKFSTIGFRIVLEDE